MRWRLEGMAEALRSPIPWVALTAALAVSAASWFGLERSHRQQALGQFERRTDSAVAAVRARMLAYEQVLRSGTARMASSPTVSREEWRQFVLHLQLEERLPGIHSMGYAERAVNDGLESAVVLFNEPSIARNTRVIGTDLYKEPLQRAAMDKSREIADAAITASMLFPDGLTRGPRFRQPGFVMFVPVYLDGGRTLTAAQRQADLAGYVFTPLRMNEVMQGVMDAGVLQRLDMRIFDQPGTNEADELLDTRTAWRAAALPDTPPIFSRTLAMPMPGRTWNVQFMSRPELDAALRDSRPWIVLWGGIVGSLVVFVLTTALLATWNRAHQLSMRDPLTGLYNRRYLDESIAREMPRARREGESIGLILLDLDHFKRLNDTYGHNAGDYVLAQLGELLRAMTRESDIACRLGGEEFAVVLPGAGVDIAIKRAERLRHALESLVLDFDGRTLDAVTLSAGVAALQPHQQDWIQVMQEADRALYAAKQAGRNRVLQADAA